MRRRPQSPVFERVARLAKTCDVVRLVRHGGSPWGDVIEDPRNPVVGTRLIREWNGVEHTITVLRDGFEWQGRPYKSLSAIARAITGTRWNGYRFFGLRERKRGND